MNEMTHFLDDTCPGGHRNEPWVAAALAPDPRDPDDAAAFEHMTGLDEAPAPVEVPAPATIDEAITQYARQRTFVDRLKADLATENERLDGLEEHLFSMMERQGLRSVRHELGSFRLDDLADATLAPDSIPAFLTWAQEHAPELLIANRMRLGKLVRDHMKGDYEFPGVPDMPPGVDFRTRRGIAWSGRKRPA